jgi:hypothetical protein
LADGIGTDVEGATAGELAERCRPLVGAVAETAVRFLVRVAVHALDAANVVELRAVESGVDKRLHQQVVGRRLDVQESKTVAQLVHDRVAGLSVVVQGIGIEVGFAGVDDHVAAVGQIRIGERARGAVEELAADPHVAADAFDVSIGS